MPASHGTPKGKQTFYVVFESVTTHWTIWNWYTEPDWRHCWLMKAAYFPEPGLMAEVFTHKLEPLRWGMDFDFWFAHPEDVSREFLQLGATAVVKVRMEVPRDYLEYVPRGFITCVSVIKAALGIRDWAVWTPKQLFLYLVRHCEGELIGIIDDGRSGEEDIRGRQST